MCGTLTRRLGACIAMLGFFAGATVLLLADRAGSVVGQVRVAVIQAGRRVESVYGIDWLDRSDVPGTADQIGHALLWGSGMFLVGWMVRRRVPIPITALFLGGVSLMYEAAQPLVSSTRVFQPSDGTANLVGILIAAFVLASGLAVSRVLFEAREVRLARVRAGRKGW